MSLFTPHSTPIFLKEDSDTTQQIARLKELQEKATGKVKDDIAREINLATYGEIGEKNIAFELKNSGMPMVIIHDLHLQHGDLTAQIDYVVVTRKLVFFIECKNLYGNVDIDNQGNFVRSYPWNGRTVKEGIYSPITQNQRHLEVFRQLRLAQTTNPLKRLGFQNNFDSFYKSIVVLANPKTVLNAKYAKKDVKDRVIRADQLIAYIKEQNIKSKEMAASEKGLKDWAEKILALHQPLPSDYTQPNGKQNQPWSPVQLVGENVVHETFGSGTIVKISKHEVVVKFKVSPRLFDFPAVFETALKLSNPVQQQKMDALIKARKS